jgi:hypothetical protein
MGISKEEPLPWGATRVGGNGTVACWLDCVGSWASRAFGGVGRVLRIGPLVVVGLGVPGRVGFGTLIELGPVVGDRLLIRGDLGSGGRRGGQGDAGVMLGSGSNEAEPVGREFGNSVLLERFDI